MKHGLKMEDQAKKALKGKMYCHIHECGLFVNPAVPFLGATPDGIVCYEQKMWILEVKCPHSYR